MNIGGGVDGATVLVNFKMNMWTSGAPTATHQGNHLPLFDDITHLNFVFHVVGVPCHVTTAVVYFNHLAVAVSIP